MTSPLTPPYSRVQLFSGGGSRFGYYLGSYAALCELSLQPDLIIATCGGSLAALLVDIAPCPNDLKRLAQSPELHQVITAIKPKRAVAKAGNHGNTAKPRYFHHALKRFFLAKSEQTLNQLHHNETAQDLLNELNHLAMFSIGNNDMQEDTWLDVLDRSKSPSVYPTDYPKPDITIISSRIIQNNSSTQQETARLQEVLFLPHKLATYPDIINSFSCPTHGYAPKRIVKSCHTFYQWNINQAVRASMADMYYLKPIMIEGVGHSLGGVIDLTPIELACQLGQTVFAESKAGYDRWLASPAIKRVFGFDPNQRLQAVHEFNTNRPISSTLQSHIHWLPFADNGKALAGQHTRKKIQLSKGFINLIHADYDEFKQQMLAQWQYGYDRTMQYMKKQKA